MLPFFIVHFRSLLFEVFFPVLLFHCLCSAPKMRIIPLQGDRDAGELCGGASRVPSTVSTSNSSRGTSPEAL